MTLHYDGEVKIAKINMGPYDNNGYIVICPETNEGIIIDTPAEPEKLINEVGDVPDQGHPDHPQTSGPPAGLCRDYRRHRRSRSSAR